MQDTDVDQKVEWRDGRLRRIDRSARRAGISIVVGAIFLVAAVAGFVIVPEHNQTVRTGLSHSAYDALRITLWALVIVGDLLVVAGLIRYARPRRRQR